MTPKELEEKIKSIPLEKFLMKKEDPLWAIYLSKESRTSSTSEKSFGILKKFFFKYASNHPLELRLTKKFAQTTVDQITDPQSLKTHIDSENKIEKIYTFYILKLKKGQNYKTFFRDNIHHFEKFIRVKRSPGLIY